MRNKPCQKVQKENVFDLFIFSKDSSFSKKLLHGQMVLQVKE